MHKTIANINEAISNALKDYKTSIMAIAEPVPVQANTKVPALINKKGECNTNLFNDKCDIGMYHRVLSNGYSSTNAGGVGDNPGLTRQMNMALVVYGKRKACDQFELEHLLISLLSRMQCKPSESLFERSEIFASEFAGVEFFIKPDYFLFRIKYSINMPILLSCNKLTTK